MSNKVSTINIFNKCVKDLEKDINSTEFNSWIKPLQFDLKENNFNIYAPNNFVGDFFKESQLNELENFLNYKNFNFQISKSQSFFNYLSLISFLMIISFVIYYLVRKIGYKH